MFIHTLFENPIFYLRVVAIVIISISLHELAHGWAALSQGDNTPETSGHMTLNPVVHMGVGSIIFLCLAGISWGQMPVNPSKFRSAKWGNIWVSAAGPLMNVAIAASAIIIINILLSAPSILSRLASVEFWYLAARLNLVLFLFNLLPVPPLDGFRVFSELFPGLKPLENSPFGLIALIIIFTSKVGVGLFAIADFAIETFIIA